MIFESVMSKKTELLIVKGIDQFTVNEDKPDQYANAPLSIYVTELGIVTDFKPVQLLNVF